MRNNNFTFGVYLWRNFPFSSVGFQLKWSGFYPDFIMWIKRDRKQIMVFIDPKGLEHSRGLDDEKIQLKNELKELEKKIGKSDLTLESYILSKTPYKELVKGTQSPPSKEEYIKHNVLFLEDENWPEILFKKLLARKE